MTAEPLTPEEEAVSDALAKAMGGWYGDSKPFHDSIARRQAAILAAHRLRVAAPSDGLREADAIGRAMHEASQVGGPWTPCTVPYGQWPECEHEPMGRHVAVIIASAALATTGQPETTDG
jgi:hypothetical protein